MDINRDLIIGPEKIYYLNNEYDYESIKIYHNDNLIYKTKNKNNLNISINIFVSNDNLIIGDSKFDINNDFKIFHNYTLIYKFIPKTRQSGMKIYRLGK